MDKNRIEHLRDMGFFLLGSSFGGFLIIDYTVSPLWLALAIMLSMMVYEVREFSREAGE